MKETACRVINLFAAEASTPAFQAVTTVLKEGKVRTYDLCKGPYASQKPSTTKQMGTAIRKMIQKIVKKGVMGELSSIKEDLDYWLSKTPEERVAAVDYLRRQYNGNTARLQRSARVIQLKQG